MGSSFLNVPTFASENDNTCNKKDNENWTLLNQVYEKIAENEEEEKNKRKRKYRKSVSDVVEYVVEKTNKYDCTKRENCSKITYQGKLGRWLSKNSNVSGDKIHNIQQFEDKIVNKNIVFTSKIYNDLNSLDITKNSLHSQNLEQNNYHNFNSVIDDKARNKQNLQVGILSKVTIKKKLQYNSVNIDSNFSKSNLPTECKYVNVIPINSYIEEIYTCARLRPYNNSNKKVEDKKIMVSGLRNKKDLISFPELPLSSLKHKRKITNSDILDPEVHGHAISKKAMVEASAYSRYQIMVSEWRHYVKMVKSKVHGFGLIANVDIPENTYIIEYTGEQIRYEIANIREKKYTESGLGVYFFQIDNDYVVDATFYGSCSRYMNHSCEANCIAHIIYINEKKKIIMISSRDIKKGEELVYDYKFDREEGSDNRIPCYCGAKKCKKWIN